MENLLSHIESFCAKYGMAEGQFGTLSLNDKNFVSDLRGGRDIRFSTAQRVTSFMASYRVKKRAAATPRRERAA